MGGERGVKIKPIDVYRDTALRYLGYLGIFGWPCSRLIPCNMMRMSCLTYVLSDIYTKTADSCQSKKKAFAVAGDATLFHLGSSIMIPNLLMMSFSRGLAKQGVSMASGLNGLLPAAMFMAMAPFVGKYIDSGTNGLLNSTYRRGMGIRPTQREKDLPIFPSLLETEKCLEEIKCSPRKTPIPVEPCIPRKGFLCFRKKRTCPPPDSV